DFPQLSPSAFMIDICNNIYFSGWGGEVNQRFNPNVGTTDGLYKSADAFQQKTDGSDFYLIVFSPFLKSISYATFIGGSTSAEHVDGGTSRFDRHAIVYQSVCAGCGRHSDFPTTAGAWSRINKSDNCNNALFKMDLREGSSAPEIKDKDLILKVKAND